jgi:hypothetical protein
VHRYKGACCNSTSCEVTGTGTDESTCKSQFYFDGRVTSTDTIIISSGVRDQPAVSQRRTKVYTWPSPYHTSHIDGSSPRKVPWHGTARPAYSRTQSKFLYQVDDAMQSRVRRQTFLSIPGTHSQHSKHPHRQWWHPEVALLQQSSPSLPCRPPCSAVMLHPSQRHITQSP